MRVLNLLVASVLAVLVGQGVSVKISTPALTSGRLTGHVTFYDTEELFFREKRQTLRNRHRIRKRDLPTTPLPPDCDSVYRTATGLCNNENNPEWGSTEQPFQRLLQPQYNQISSNGQTIYAPRAFSAISGAALPNVRLISRRIHDPLDRPETRPIMAMQWGQFIDHDITSTPVNPSTKTCCSIDLVTSGATQHSDVSTSTEGPCFPILIPPRDPHFTTDASRCMENKRSYQVNVDGKPEQINLITAFIDGSAIYGSDDSTMENLRSKEKGRGRLLEINNNLPAGDADTCLIDHGRENIDYCLATGDSRVNQYPGLGALHTVFMRMHNLVADGLAAVNPSWNNDKVFQESRRIIGALLQKITYLEWLRSILGDTVLNQYRLTNGGYEYEPETNPTLYNVFSTAAFRFGHSMITDTLTINDMAFESIDLFNRPHHVLTSLDSLLEGLLADNAQRTDRWYSEGMTNHMFETAPMNGMDIVSLNIQRGRDHGLPPYNDWRELCGLGRINNFDGLETSRRRYSSVYNDIDDLDLYSGALSERPVAQGAVGQTYACLIGRQFERLKFGDRFWYENPLSPNPFTPAQIREIENQSLATILCQTTGVTSVQRNAFMALDERRNPAVNCSSVTPINYSLFTD